MPELRSIAEAELKSIADFGKIFFIPTHESVPPLPDMDLLFFYEEERGEIFPWRAVCIDLEIDAVGNSMEEAWDGLKNALTMFIDMEKKKANDSIIETAKRIIRTAFTLTEQKMAYINLYKLAELDYTMGAIDSGGRGKGYDPIKDKKDMLKKLTAIKEPIRYTATVKARVAA
jgi:hypothetical protein